ncbi:hypothetical protein BJ170DRAFT_618065 [Xylariales sp. AK1849]|nr:hypothetical protein BJ170DRAFT_618065 [Xylariales sp. AK1849]
MASTAPKRRDTSTDYNGPMPPEMIANHTLAKEIIDRHNDPCPIFDDRSIKLLREFDQDPTSAQDIVRRLQLEVSAGQSRGTTAKDAGDLVGYIIASHGAEKAALTDDEIMNLKNWFQGGEGKTDDEL